MVTALGIDVGSTGVRAAVLADDGRLLGHARRPVATRMPAPGWVEQDPRDWLAGALGAGAEAVRAADVVPDAVGVGALGPAPVLVDDDLEPLAAAPLYALDGRAEPQRRRLGAGIDSALPTLVWFAERRPGLAGRAAHALDATGFLVSSLTGTPTMDTVTREAYAGPAPPPVRLPDPIAPLDVAGGLAAAPARRLGLAAGTPVAAGTYDTYVDLGALVDGDGDGAVLLGSTLAVYVVAGAMEASPGLELTAYPGPGRLAGGTTATAGTALRWLADVLGGGPAREDVDVLAPAAEGVLMLPYLAGERAPLWDADARGVIAGLSLRAGRRELLRAGVDALACSALALAERLPAPRRWRASGGGANDTAWLRATCDALGAPLEVAAHAGEAAGPAVIALRAIGAAATLPTVADVAPRPERTAAIRALAGRARRLHEAVRPLAGAPA
jgi:xylulokinase